jgi:hypothetical protein
VNWQVPGLPDADAATVPPVSVIVLVPGTAATVPPHVLLSSPPGAITSPVGLVGMVSVTERAVAIVVVLLSTWIVRILVSPETTLAGVKDLLTRN